MESLTVMPDIKKELEMSTITPILDGLFRFAGMMIARPSRRETLQPAQRRFGLDFDRFLSKPAPTFRPLCDKTGRLDLRRFLNASAA